MAREASPAFQFYPNEWLGSRNIALMTPAMEGAYIRLLAYSWTDPDCCLPDDDKKLACLSRLHDGWDSTAKDLILGGFKKHPKRKGFIYNRRLLKEREKQIAFSENRRKAGEKGAKKRWHSDSSANGEPMANDSLSSSTSSSSSNTKNPPTPRKPKPKPAPLKIDFPTELDSIEFRNSWKDWEKHRKEIKHPLTQTQAEKQLRKFSKWGQDRAVAAIEHTITQGWQGIREPDQDNARQTTKPYRKPTPI